MIRTNLRARLYAVKAVCIRDRRDGLLRSRVSVPEVSLSQHRNLKVTASNKPWKEIAQQLGEGGGHPCPNKSASP
jgi:hypothetical protein